MRGWSTELALRVPGSARRLLPCAVHERVTILDVANASSDVSAFDRASYRRRVCVVRRLVDCALAHWEVGFWHALSESDVELSCTVWGGRAEVLRGTLALSPDGFVLTLHSTQVANDPRIGRTTREFVLRGGTLRYSMQMSTTAVPDLTPHTRAELSR